MHVSKFKLDMRKLVPLQVVYYQYCIGGRVVLGMLLDETKKKRGLDIVRQAIPHDPIRCGYVI